MLASCARTTPALWARTTTRWRASEDEDVVSVVIVGEDEDFVGAAGEDETIVGVAGRRQGRHLLRGH